MKRLLATAAVVLLTCGVAAAQEPAKAGAKMASPVAQALMANETAWTKAAKAGDFAAVAALLADDFVSVDSDGTTSGKSDVIARVKKAKWMTNEVADMKVMEHGNSAVVTGTWTAKGTGADGKPVDTKERWVDTWVKMASGKWQCVGSGSATMK